MYSSLGVSLARCEDAHVGLGAAGIDARVLVSTLAIGTTFVVVGCGGRGVGGGVLRVIVVRVGGLGVIRVSAVLVVDAVVLVVVAVVLVVAAVIVDGVRRVVVVVDLVHIVLRVVLVASNVGLLNIVGRRSLGGVVGIVRIVRRVVDRGRVVVVDRCRLGVVVGYRRSGGFRVFVRVVVDIRRVVRAATAAGRRAR